LDGDLVARIGMAHGTHTLLPNAPDMQRIFSEYRAFFDVSECMHILVAELVSANYLTSTNSLK
jgi:hypothetical protein